MLGWVASPLWGTLIAAASLAWIVAAVARTPPYQRSGLWLLLALGLIIGHSLFRHRSVRPWLQHTVTLVVLVLPNFPGVIGMWFSTSALLFSTLLPAMLLGAIAGALIDRSFGVRPKQLRAAWCGVERVGGDAFPEPIVFEVGALSSEVSKAEVDAIKARMHNFALLNVTRVARLVVWIGIPLILLCIQPALSEIIGQGGEDVASQLLGFSAVMSLLAFAFTVLAWFGHRGRKHATTPGDHARLARFAYTNGLEYEPGPISDRPGRALSRIVRLQGNRPWFLANAMKENGGSRDDTLATHFSGVIELDAGVELPHLFLLSHQHRLPAFSSDFAPLRGQKLALEGNFNHFFTLYCPAGYERDALYLFTPDIMARLIDGVHRYDLELVGRRLILRSRADTVTLDPGRWQSAAIAVNALSDRIGQWANWRDERLPQGASVLAMRSRRVARAGRTLRVGVTMTAMLGIAYMACYLLLTLISGQLHR